MHAIGILQRCLCPLLKHVHARRLTTLLEAVVSCVGGPALSLTDVGRRFAGEALLRHKIKRADRLLGNRQLQQEARSIYAALCRVTLARIGEPVILIDWSDLKADQSLHLLRASLPVGGRALTLYEEVHPQNKLGNRAVQHRFLQRLGELLPGGAAPIIVADSGFKVPFYREVERLGWRWGQGGCADVTACSPQNVLGQLQDDLPACHRDTNGSRRGIMGAQQSAPGNLRGGAPR